MLPLIMAACGAASSVADVITICTVKEQDTQTVKRYEKVKAELINSRDNLQQRYYELTDKSNKQIEGLNETEMEKDIIYLALESYHELMGLREYIDLNPSLEILVEFHKAIEITNHVLKKLDRFLVPVDSDYFKDTVTRIEEKNNIDEKQLFEFMSRLIDSQEDTVNILLSEIEQELFSQATIKIKEDKAMEIY